MSAAARAGRASPSCAVEHLRRCRSNRRSISTIASSDYFRWGSGPRLDDARGSLRRRPTTGPTAVLASSAAFLRPFTRALIEALRRPAYAYQHSIVPMPGRRRAAASSIRHGPLALPRSPDAAGERRAGRRPRSATTTVEETLFSAAALGFVYQPGFAQDDLQALGRSRHLVRHERAARRRSGPLG